MNPAVAEWTVEALARLMLTFAILIGIAILLGGEARFSGPSYTVALQLPGAPQTWAILALVPGAVGLLCDLRGRRRPVSWALFLLAVWCLFFAYSFVQTMFYIASAGATGGVVYGTLAIVALVLGVAYFNWDD